MPHLRLIGLVLFTTAILLGLAAAATKTTHIRIQTGAADHTPLANPVVIQQSDPPNIDFEFGQQRESPPAPIEVTPLQFTSIPVVWPLLATGTLGLLLWFIQPSQLDRGRSRKSRRRRR